MPDVRSLHHGFIFPNIQKIRVHFYTCVCGLSETALRPVSSKYQILIRIEGSQGQVGYRLKMGGKLRIDSNRTPHLRPVTYPNALSLKGNSQRNGLVRHIIALLSGNTEN